MNTSSADDLGRRAAALLEMDQAVDAGDLLAPFLSRRTPFHLLDRIGARIGAGPLAETNDFLELIAREKPMGAWPLIGSALAAQLVGDFEGALARCRSYIIFGGVWYAADTLAERVPGAALVMDFNRALSILADWRSDPDRWVRKSAGVAIHLWTKRSRGEERHLPKVRRLLAFLAPMFGEQDIDAAKGIGWALKTLGRNYPSTTEPWLVKQVKGGHGYRALTLRKATTYLSKAARNRVYLAASR